MQVRTVLPLCAQDFVLTAVRYAFGTATGNAVGTLRAGAYFARTSMADVTNTAREGAMVYVEVRTPRGFCFCVTR